MAVLAPENQEKIPILDVHVHRVTMEETLCLIDHFVREGGTHHVVTLDSAMCVMARQDDQLRAIIQGADLVTPDSAGVLWASRRCGSPLPQRVAGIEIVERLCALSAERGYRLFFLGAAPGVAQTAAEKMRLRYPGCCIVGTHDGFFSPVEEPAIIERINQSRPDVLCVALGIPKQEKWIARNRARLNASVCIGIGGTLDVLSGRVKRAPHWMQRLNLEWLYRFLSNPRKIRKILTLPRFVWLTLTTRPS